MNNNFEHNNNHHSGTGEVLKYTCPKCGNKTYEIGELWAYSNFWTKMMQLHTRRFTFLTCQSCKFTEFYKVPRKQIGEVINFASR